MSLLHSCDIFVLTCIDFRLHPQLENLLQQDFGFSSFDFFAAAGAIKNLVEPEKPEDRDFILRQIVKSQKLHQIKKVILINHTDCGAYGGTKAFETPEVEEQKHFENLRVAEKIIKENFPQLEIILFLAGLSEGEGKWRVELKKID